MIVVAESSQWWERRENQSQAKPKPNTAVDVRGVVSIKSTPLYQLVQWVVMSMKQSVTRAATAVEATERDLFAVDSSTRMERALEVLKPLDELRLSFGVVGGVHCVRVMPVPQHLLAQHAHVWTVLGEGHNALERIVQMHPYGRS